MGSRLLVPNQSAGDASCVHLVRDPEVEGSNPLAPNIYPFSNQWKQRLKASGFQRVFVRVHEILPSRTLAQRFCENVDMQCLYCSAPGDSLEHALPAALGEFRDAPNLANRVCTPCNNTRLGVLDEQLTRCGPEAFLRKFYDIRGRTATHDKVNIFERRSAGGQRVDMRSVDKALGVEVGLVLEAAGEGTKMADHVSPIFRPAFPSSAIISERSSPSRVRFAAPNNGAPLTAPGRSGQHF